MCASVNYFSFLFSRIKACATGATVALFFICGLANSYLPFDTFSIRIRSDFSELSLSFVCTVCRDELDRRRARFSKE